MCFSAEAGFATAAVLLPAGIYCSRIAVRKNLAYLPLAVLPLIFSFQQLTEGFVWVGLDRSDHALVTVASLAFLAFALGFWPFWVPFSLLCFESRRGVRWCLTVAALLGLFLGGALYLPLAFQADEWLQVTVVHHSIRYNTEGLPVFALVPAEICDAAYGSIVFVSLLLAPQDRRFDAFRVLAAVSALICLLLFRHAFVSVWCFFAALVSAQLCFTFRKVGRRSEA